MKGEKSRLNEVKICFALVFPTKFNICSPSIWSLSSNFHKKTKVTCTEQILFLRISILFNKPTSASLMLLRTSPCSISVGERRTRALNNFRVAVAPQRVECWTMTQVMEAIGSRINEKVETVCSQISIWWWKVYRSRQVIWCQEGRDGKTSENNLRKFKLNSKELKNVREKSTKVNVLVHVKRFRLSWVSFVWIPWQVWSNFQCKTSFKDRNSSTKLLRLRKQSWLCKQTSLSKHTWANVEPNVYFDSFKRQIFSFQNSSRWERKF